MLHRDVLAYVDKLLRDVAPRDGSEKKPFGGKCVILGGDWKQLCPVVIRGGRPEQVNASIKKDPLFKLFTTLRLTQNMRADPDEIAFGEWLLDIGNGKNARGNNSASPLKLHDEQISNSLDDVISYCFPQRFFLDPFKNQSYFSLLFTFAICLFKASFVNQLSSVL